MENVDTGNAPASAATESVTESPSVSSQDTSAQTSSSEGSSIRDTMAAVFEKHHPPRAEGGQFAPKVSPETPAAEAAPGAEVTGQPETTATETVNVPSIDAPQSWSAEMKAKFGSLPPEVREFISKREGESHKAITQMGQQVKAYEPVAKIVEQNRDLFAAFGRSPDQGVNELLAVQRALMQGPESAASAIQKIAQSYNVDLSRFAQPGTEGRGMAPDPRIAGLEQQLAKVNSILTAQQREQVEARQKSVETEIQEFSKGKTHWSDLEEDILHEVTAIRSGDPSLSPKQVLEKAYERAQWANPTIRERILADQRKADEDKRRADQQQKAALARKDAPLNQRSTTGVSPSTPGTMRDSMRAVAEKYGIR